MTKEIECPPHVANFSKSLKNIGYNHYSAVLDLIDNSISAKATKIWVDYLIEKGGGYKVIVADNGYGMDRKALFEAMRIASSDPLEKRQDDDLGKFGLGLKFASFSQTDIFSVVSKHNKSLETYSFTWDLPFVRNIGKWLIREEDTAKFLRPKKQGTEVILHNVFDKAEVDIEKIIGNLRIHIAVAYHLKKGVKFYINEKEIEPIDPFFRKNIASNESNPDSIVIGKAEIKVQSHQIPHRHKMTPKEKRIFDEMTEINMGPGLYIYRKNRLIAWSGWEGLGRNLRINDLYRMAVFCNGEADNLFNIEVKKSQISITDVKLSTFLKSSIMNFTDVARRPYKKRAELSLKDISDIWILKKNENGKVIFTINKNSDAIKALKNDKIDLNKLLEFLENTIPYESLLYYLNLNKLDEDALNQNKLKTALLMYELGLISDKELIKLKNRYEH